MTIGNSPEGAVERGWLNQKPSALELLYSSSWVNTPWAVPLRARQWLKGEAWTEMLLGCCYFGPGDLQGGRPHQSRSRRLGAADHGEKNSGEETELANVDSDGTDAG